MNIKGITIEQANAVIAARREADRKAEIAKNRALIGTCWKYHNSSGATDPKWWLYAIVTGVGVTGTPEGWSFQHTSSGEMEIRGDRSLYVHTDGHMGYRRITRREFDAAARAFRKATWAQFASPLSPPKKRRSRKRES
jgi:hypothetical protein